ncbi:4a-hydroxytetrahydrobiopterin dehydratase [Allocatelliglobosispora scoriae]|uniref:Putative pterin-4-alpha-carbinolamine dehydratase n=1 Tax=Allocatelliglobosispora scoriae TaxID=643052 RepID=A0A841BT69_9ACTN|nr:4a-hydroxytetrahydrobiopterin dehydratase [Allocatelliglobosispora scoriae]MBB5870359.1 4a-hydroxytetrahydrobiopterin dehydratase [Allocatelliglobosispora scoriae]
MALLLTGVEIDAALSDLGEWTGGPAGLSRVAELGTFPQAIGVVDRVAVVAEELDHHPDIDIRWRRLTFFCTTHSDGGVTALDLELASRIEAILREAFTKPAPRTVQ